MLVKGAPGVCKEKLDINILVILFRPQYLNAYIWSQGINKNSTRSDDDKGLFMDYQDFTQYGLLVPFCITDYDYHWSR